MELWGATSHGPVECYKLRDPWEATGSGSVARSCKLWILVVGLEGLCVMRLYNSSIISPFTIYLSPSRIKSPGAR